MKKWLNYENFWTRNIGTFLFFYGIMLITEYFSIKDTDFNHFSVFQLFGLFIVLYGLVLTYNLLILKNLLFKRKIKKFILASVLYMPLMALFFYLFSYGLDEHISYLKDLGNAFFALLIGSTPYFMHTWILENTIKTKKELINKKAELTFLKQQISPHFLFNALNNLYGTALADPYTVPEKILQLSDLLRYQIESTKIDYIHLNEEIAFTEKYLDYIQFKSSNLKISNIVLGTTENYFLPPLLMLPLIENAVKFSLETENPFIEIKWNLLPDTIVFEIKNPFQTRNSKTKGTKTGIENLQKRLEVHRIKHELNFFINDTSLYIVILKLWKTDSNV